MWMGTGIAGEGDGEWRARGARGVVPGTPAYCAMGVGKLSSLAVVEQSHTQSCSNPTRSLAAQSRGAQVWNIRLGGQASPRPAINLNARRAARGGRQTARSLPQERGLRARPRGAPREPWTQASVCRRGCCLRPTGGHEPRKQYSLAVAWWKVACGADARGAARATFRPWCRVACARTAQARVVLRCSALFMDARTYVSDGPLR